MKTKLSLFLILILSIGIASACKNNTDASDSTSARLNSSGGGGIISGEPVKFDVLKKCDLVSIDPTFDESGEIQFLYESYLDSYTILVTLNDGSEKQYFPAIKSNLGLIETYFLYQYHDTPNQPLLGLIELSPKTNSLKSYSSYLQDFKIQNCISEASIDY